MLNQDTKRLNLFDGIIDPHNQSVCQGRKNFGRVYMMIRVKWTPYLLPEPGGAVRVSSADVKGVLRDTGSLLITVRV